MNKPNYHGGGLINLVASIENAMGGRSKYKSLSKLNPSELKDSKNIVLMLIDGLGYDFLMKNGKGTAFNKNTRGRMTSVFPSSTSAAIPTLMTGLSPQEHGMTGWFMYLREFGSQIIPLPFIPRLKGGSNLGKLIKLKDVFNIKPVSDRLKVKTYVVQGNKILNSDFTVAAAGKAKRMGYNKMGGYFRAIKAIINSNSQRKFIFAYYPEHDSLCHKNGSTNKKVLRHFKKLSKKLDFFIKSIEGTKTTIIITADHGITDVHPTKRINMRDHPELKETLVMPLCGEHRFAYAYVRPSEQKEFERYVNTRLKHCCELFKSGELLSKGYFGISNTHDEFKNRIGDYILIMKDHYGIYDDPIYQKRDHYHIGDHGGTSSEELYVPLIVIRR